MARTGSHLDYQWPERKSRDHRLDFWRAGKPRDKEVAGALPGLSMRAGTGGTTLRSPGSSRSAWSGRNAACSVRQPAGRPPCTNSKRQGGSQGKAAAGVAASPWSSKRPQELREVAWPENLPSHLVRTLLAEQLRVNEEQAGAQLQRLLLLLPGLPQRLPGMRLQHVARLVRDVGAVAATLIELRTIFPGADVEELIMREPSLMLDIQQSGGGMAHLQQEVDELRALLPGVDTDRAVSEHPYIVRDFELLKQAVQHMKASMPHLDNQQILAMAGNVHVLSVFKGGHAGTGVRTAMPLRQPVNNVVSSQQLPQISSFAMFSPEHSAEFD